jgi:hypothetical protein
MMSNEAYWREKYEQLKAQRQPDHTENNLAMVQEPVAWITERGKGFLRWHKKSDAELNKNNIPLYKHPKRKPLRDEEIALISAECSLRTPSDIYFARAIEAAHGIGDKS